jgi:hypothetical protein
VHCLTHIASCHLTATQLLDLSNGVDSNGRRSFSSDFSWLSLREDRMSDFVARIAVAAWHEEDSTPVAVAQVQCCALYL